MWPQVGSLPIPSFSLSVHSPVSRYCSADVFYPSLSSFLFPLNPGRRNALGTSPQCLAKTVSCSCKSWRGIKIQFTHMISKVVGNAPHGSHRVVARNSVSLLRNEKIKKNPRLLGRNTDISHFNSWWIHWTLFLNALTLWQVTTVHAWFLFQRVYRLPSTV